MTLDSSYLISSGLAMKWVCDLRVDLGQVHLFYPCQSLLIKLTSIKVVRPKPDWLYSACYGSAVSPVIHSTLVLQFVVS